MLAEFENWLECA